jgi:hypothetical protein
MIALFGLAALLVVQTDNTQEIGRVRAHAAACVASRDIVAPAFKAARAADTIFTAAAPTYGEYAAAKANSRTLPTNVVQASGKKMASKLTAADPWGATTQMYAQKLDQAIAGIQRNLLTISNALGDPRIAPTITDPDVQAQRTQLLNLYNAQAARLVTLVQFSQRESLSTAFDRMDDNSALAGKLPVPDAPDDGSTIPVFGQPQLNGLAGNDKSAMKDWTDGLATAIHKQENLAAKTFFDIATACKAADAGPAPAPTPTP